MTPFEGVKRLSYEALNRAVNRTVNALTVDEMTFAVGEAMTTLEAQKANLELLKQLGIE